MLKVLKCEKCRIDIRRENAHVFFNETYSFAHAVTAPYDYRFPPAFVVMAVKNVLNFSDVTMSPLVSLAKFIIALNWVICV